MKQKLFFVILFSIFFTSCVSLYHVKHREYDDLKSPFYTDSVQFYSDILYSLSLEQTVSKTNSYYSIELVYSGTNWLFIGNQITIEAGDDVFTIYGTKPYRHVYSVTKVEESTSAVITEEQLEKIISAENVRFQFFGKPVSITKAGKNNIKRFYEERKKTKKSINNSEEEKLQQFTLPSDTDGYKYIGYENGYFIISWIPYEYKFSNEEYHLYRNISTSYHTFAPEAQKTIKHEGAYFLINGTSLKLEYKGDNEFIELNEYGAYRFKKDGIATVYIQIGDSIKTEVQINQITLPLSQYDKKDSLIEKIGFADYSKSDSIEWPNKKTIDGIFYDTTEKVKDIYITHYFYKKYPYLCISYDLGGLYRCGTTRNWNKNF